MDEYQIAYAEIAEEYAKNNPEHEFLRSKLHLELSLTARALDLDRLRKKVKDVTRS